MIACFHLPRIALRFDWSYLLDGDVIDVSSSSSSSSSTSGSGGGGSSSSSSSK